MRTLTEAGCGTNYCKYYPETAANTILREQTLVLRGGKKNIVWSLTGQNADYNLESLLPGSDNI